MHSHAYKPTYTTQNLCRTGDVVVNGTFEAVTAIISGTGNVYVDGVDGEVQAKLTGTGNLYIISGMRTLVIVRCIGLLLVKWQTQEHIVYSCTAGVDITGTVSSMAKIYHDASAECSVSVCCVGG